MGRKKAHLLCRRIRVVVRVALRTRTARRMILTNSTASVGNLMMIGGCGFVWVDVALCVWVGVLLNGVIRLVEMLGIWQAKLGMKQDGNLIVI